MAKIDLQEKTRTPLRKYYGHITKSLKANDITNPNWNGNLVDKEYRLTAKLIAALIVGCHDRSCPLELTKNHIATASKNKKEKTKMRYDKRNEVYYWIKIRNSLMYSTEVKLLMRQHDGGGGTLASTCIL